MARRVLGWLRRSTSSSSSSSSIRGGGEGGDRGGGDRGKGGSRGGGDRGGGEGKEEMARRLWEQGIEAGWSFDVVEGYRLLARGGRKVGVVGEPRVKEEEEEEEI